MSKTSPATQPSKAVVPTLQEPTTTLDQKHTDLAVVGVITLPKEDIEKLLRSQAPQQSTTINVQINNTIINNYNGPAPPAQNLGHQGESRDRSHQSLPTTASASRAIGGKPHGMENVPPAPSSIPKTHARIQHGSGDRVNSTPPARSHAPPTQDKPRLETTAVPHKRSAIDQVNLGTTQNGSSKPPCANVSAGQVSGQGRREASHPRSSGTSSGTIGLLDKILQPHTNKKASPSATTSPARGSKIGIREGSAVKQLQKQANPHSARPHYQPPSEARGRMAPEQSMVTSQDRGNQPTKRQEPTVGSHGHPAANNSEDHRMRALPEVPKELKKEDIEKYLEDLNCRLGNHKSETSSGPARLILISKASAEMMGLQTTEKVYHIDVMLDLQATGERLVQIRQCMKQAGVFREFDRPEENTKKAWRTFFGTRAHRAVVFNDIAGKGKCVSNKKHLKAYVMDTDRALEFELRRMADRASDQRTKDTSLNIAAALWEIRERGEKLDDRRNCQDLRYIRADGLVPGDSITAVENLYAKRKAASLPGN